jgi:hypothetical protein
MSKISGTVNPFAQPHAIASHQTRQSASNKNKSTASSSEEASESGSEKLAEAFKAGASKKSGRSAHLQSSLAGKLLNKLV